MLDDERFDKFYETLKEANNKGWITTCTTPKFNLEESGMVGRIDEESERWLTIENKGLKYGHTYVILDIKVVKLPEFTDIIALFRNPSGKDCRGP